MTEQQQQHQQPRDLSTELKYLYDEIRHIETTLYKIQQKQIKLNTTKCVLPRPILPLSHYTSDIHPEQLENKKNEYERQFKLWAIHLETEEIRWETAVTRFNKWQEYKEHYLALYHENYQKYQDLMIQDYEYKMSKLSYANYNNNNNNNTTNIKKECDFKLPPI